MRYVVHVGAAAAQAAIDTAKASDGDPHAAVLRATS
jgi:hypothetical protein